MVAHSCRVIYEVFIFHYLQHSKACDHSEIVATKRGTQHPTPRFDVRMDKYSSYREPVTHALSRGDQVRSYICMLMSKEFSCPTITTLYLIQYEHHILFATLTVNQLQE